ncbi:unnamed protein product [Closterium sp. Yama58-4]|nr:unnamed protein product [Closterium sp. Yama58-4]
MPVGPPIQRLSDDLLSRIISLLSRSDGQLSHASVCQQWHDIAYRVQDSICLSADRFLDTRQLLPQLSRFVNLKKIDLSAGSLKAVSDDLLCCLSDTCHNLTDFRVAFHKPDSFGQSDSSGVFTEDGLSRLFTNCTRLQDLHLHCPDHLTAIPPSIDHLASLTNFHLQAEGVEILPDTFTSLQSLRHLVLRLAKLEDFPQNLENLTLLESLVLEDCASMVPIPESIEKLANLHRLSFIGFWLLRLPDSLSNLSSLEFLEIRKSVIVQKLPANLVHLHALETLHLQDIFKTPDLTESLGQLQRLKRFTMINCLTISSLPRDLIRLPSLTDLDLSLPELSELPAEIGQISKLQTLALTDVKNVTSLPDSISLATSLQKLSLNGLVNLTSLPEEFGQLAALETLHLDALPQLTHLPESFGNLTNLRYLRFMVCYQLQQLPESLSALVSLEHLILLDCWRLTSLPSSVGNGLPNLRELDILYCRSLTGLPPSISNLSSLKSLSIMRARRFTGKLPEGLGSLGKLEKLFLRDMRHLSGLPASVSGLLSLTSLVLINCPEVESLPEDIGRLGSLQELKLLKLQRLDCIPGRSIMDVDGDGEQRMRFSLDGDFDDGQFINGEFFSSSRRQGRQQTRDDVLYGVFNEASDDEDDDDEGFGGGGKRRRKKRRGKDDLMGKGDFTKPVWEPGGRRKEEEEEEEEEDHLAKTAFGQRLRERAEQRREMERERAKQEKQEASFFAQQKATRGVAGGLFGSGGGGGGGKGAAHGVGAFEKHTKGIGMKLLEKMGYKGGGLGKNQQGIAKPIEAKLRPKNMGMGFNDFKEKEVGLPPPPSGKDGEVVGAEGEGGVAVEVVEKRGREKLWKKKFAGRRKEYKTAAELLEEKQAEGREVTQTILDMRGAQVRVLTNMDRLNEEQKLQEDDTPMPELQHNLRLVVDLAEADIQTIDKRLRFQRDSLTALKHERDRTQQRMQQQAQQLTDLQRIVGVLENVLSSAPPPLPPPSTASAEALAQDSHAIATSVATPLAALRRLREQHPEEFKMYNVSAVALGFVLPRLAPLFRTWNPLAHPSHGHAVLSSWRSVLARDIGGRGGAKGGGGESEEDNGAIFADVALADSVADPGAAAGGVGGAPAEMDPYARLVADLVLPAVRSAVVNLWEPREPEPLLNFLDTWRAPVLPSVLLRTILAHLVFPKLAATVEAWDPRLETVPVHQWLHPWLPYLGSQLETLYPTIRFRLGSALTAWHPSDSSALAMLAPWKSVFDAASWDTLVSRSIVPKLIHLLQTEFLVNPQQQQLEPFHWAMSWAGVVPTRHLIALLDTAFFPQWHQVLYHWLCANPNFDEVTRWYLGWKALFPAELLSSERVRQQLNVALDMMNQAVEGMPVLQPGVKENVSYLRVSEQQAFADGSRTYGDLSGRSAYSPKRQLSVVLLIVAILEAGFLVVFSPPVKAQAVADSQKPALQVILNAWGQSLQLSQTWFVASDCSQWLGLTCNSLGEVISLEFPGRTELRGASIPAAVTQLTALQKLSLDHTLLVGEIPADIGFLTALTNLSLSGNALTGGLPISIASLVNLRSLDVSSNRLTGDIPNVFSGLTALTILALGSNGFTGVFPPALLSLSQLQFLLVGDNQFSGFLPESIVGLQSLVALDVSRNQFYGNLPAALGAFTGLVFLDVSNNQFSGTPTSSFASASLANTAQATYDLSGNFFSSLPAGYTAQSADFCPSNLEGAFAQANLAQFGASKSSSLRENCFLGGNWNVSEHFNNGKGKSNKKDPKKFAGSSGGSASAGTGCSVAAQRRSIECVAFCGAALPAGACGGLGYCTLSQPSLTPACICYDGMYNVTLSVNVGGYTVTYPSCSPFQSPVTPPPPPPSDDTMRKRDSRGAKLDGAALISGSYYNQYFRHMTVGFTGTVASPQWTIPPTVDWTSRIPSALLAAKNQGACSACWIFAPVAAIEAAYAITYNLSPPNISEQKAIDCQGTWSCDGGKPDDAFNYVAASGGLPASDSYPYTGILNYGTCKISARFRVRRLLSTDDAASTTTDTANTVPAHHSRMLAIYKPAGASSVPATMPSAPYSISMFESIGVTGWLGIALAVQRQPVVVYIDARSDSFKAYTGGFVYKDPGCYGSGIVDHLVVVVGFNMMDAVPYWIVRNSWGPSWGENGYMRIAIAGGAGICGMNTMPGLYPVLSTPDPCKPINPCGGGTCTSTPTNKSQRNKCTCTAGFIAVTNLDKTQTCALAKVCTFFAVNPCGFGTCVDDSKGGYTCLCSLGYTSGSLTDGSPTCVPGSLVSKVVLPTAMSCGLVRTTYQLSKKDFTLLNPKLKCAGNFPAGTTIVIRSAGTSAATLGCVVPYTIAQGDTCASIATLFNVTQAYLNVANPDLECNALTPGQQICVQTGTPQVQSCTSYYTVSPGETCSDVMINTYPAISATQLYQYNPGLICSSDSSQRLVGQDVCVESVVVGATTCYYGTYTVVSGDTCSSVACKVFRCSFSLMYYYNPGWSCTSSSLYVGKVLCKPRPW